MAWPSPLPFFLLTLLTFCLSEIASASSLPRTVDIFYHPLSASSASKPARLAEISYDTTTFQPSILSYTLPSTKSAYNDLLRIGLYTDASHKHWVGSLASVSAFTNSSATPSLSLYISSDNEVYNVAISPSLFAEDKKQNLHVELVRSNPAPTPHLNRPIVVREEGQEGEEVAEKTLLQRYWWAIPIAFFFVLNSGGSGGE